VASFVDFCNHFSSDPRAQPSNRPIPADSISSIDVVVLRAGRTRALPKAEALADLSRLSPGCCHRIRGRSRRFRYAPAVSLRFGRFRAFVAATP
jgi:hypothetical protein